jgi:hypothetical protein
MAYTTRDIRNVANALVGEIREHGAPNKFSPGWLCRMDPHLPSPMIVGRIARECNVMLPELVREQIPGVSVTYANRQFVVTGEF